jgi:RHS repeat-associated protein
VRLTDPLARATTYQYDGAGNRTALTDPAGRVTRYGYDAAARLTGVTDPLGKTTTSTYDANGRLVSTALPSGITTSNTYDSRGLQTSMRDGLADTTTYAYDAAGRRSSETNPKGNSTAFAYDSTDRLVTITDALGGRVTLAYDAAGEGTSTTNPRGDMASRTYDSLGNVATETNPGGGVTTYTYDAAGQQVTQVDPRGMAVTKSYDAGGHLVATAFTGGSITRAYDALGRRTSMRDPTGTTTFSYDAASELTAVAAPQGQVTYSYEASGLRSAMTLPGSRSVSYTYDGGGRLAQLRDWLGHATSFQYNVDGRQTSVSRANGVNTSLGYDGAGRLVSENHDTTGGPVAHYAYNLDANGNRVSMTAAAGAESYTLDTLDRLVGVTYPGGGAAAYTYDAAGNRLSATEGLITTPYVYDSAGRLTRAGTTSFTYDAAGNATSAGADTFAWDWNGRLSDATVGGTHTSFTYDGDDVRVGSSTASPTSYVLDRAGSLPLLVDDGSKGYVHAGGLLSQADGGGTTQYALSDALGSVRQLADGSGAVVGTRGFGVFGDTRAQSGVSSVFGFTGEQTDASTGLYYLRARYQSTSLGRFLAADTVQPNAPGTQGYNLYSYVANDPTTRVDPNGRQVFAEFTGTSTISRTAAAAIVTLGVTLIAYDLLRIEQAFCGVGLSGCVALPFPATRPLTPTVPRTDPRSKATDKPIDIAPPKPKDGGERPAIIGETQMRVDLASVAYGADVYPGFPNNEGLPKSPNLTSAQLADNIVWINAQMNIGKLILDIGLDSNRPSRSTPYATELEQIAKRGYAKHLYVLWPPSPASIFLP